MTRAEELEPAGVPDLLAVRDAFALPGRVLGADVVAGSWSNLVLRMRTTAGDLALKVVRNPWGVPEWLDWLAEGWLLEHAAAAGGVRVPQPVAVPGDGGCVAWVPSADAAVRLPVRLHRWQPGEAVAREPVGDALARWTGETVARVHALAMKPLRPELYADRAGLTTVAHWPALVSRAREAGAPWAGLLASSEPLAARASALLEPWDDADAVLVHGDLDQKNLLLGPDGPVLLDWDVVLPSLPAHDLAHAALTMAAWRDPRAARAVLDGYAAVAGAAPRVRGSDLGPALASRLGWIRFSVDRSIDAGPPYDLDLVGLLEDLDRRVGVAERVEDWLAG
ncbi:MAG: phosphotransferase [Frankiales bacterium]|nr:phosphotransferase [Frankiales bacterium]